MRLLFINLRDQKFVTGSNFRDLYYQLSGIKYDTVNRRLTFFNKPDTVSFSNEFTPEELQIELARRTIDILTRDYGWKLYKEA
jgi:hypothetical protein